jgi:hypothetical protein
VPVGRKTVRFWLVERTDKPVLGLTHHAAPIGRPYSSEGTPYFTKANVTATVVFAPATAAVPEFGVAA